MTCGECDEGCVPTYEVRISTVSRRPFDHFIDAIRDYVLVRDEHPGLNVTLVSVHTVEVTDELMERYA